MQLRSLALLCALTPISLFAQDNKVVTAPATPAELTQRSWDLLSTTVQDTKHVDNCIQALAALGTMGTNARAAEMIRKAMTDAERDIRTAAILAAAQTKNPTLIPALRKALDDAEPEVAFTAAIQLWKIHDHTGDDLLIAVVNGDRSPNGKLLHNAKHSAAREMHNPAAMAKLGAMQGAAILLGPFGFGLQAAEYARKNGGDSARAQAVNSLAELHTQEVHDVLVDALDDKDTAVRAAAAKGLGQWTDGVTAGKIAPLLDDGKLPVRLTAAAAYLRSSGARSVPASNRKH